MNRLNLAGAVVELHDSGLTRTIFPGGYVDAYPQDNEEYRNRAKELGYGDDVFAMSRDHEILHAIVSLVFGYSMSPTLRGVALERYFEHWREEEALVLAAQRFARCINADVVKIASRISTLR